MSDVTVESDKPIVGKVSGMKPGVINGKRVHARINTAKPSSLKKRAEKALAGITRHLEMHPKDSVSQNRASYLRGVV